MGDCRRRGDASGKDLDRARTFYVDRLGLTVDSEDETGVHFVVGGSRFRLFRSAGSAAGSHTQLALTVPDIGAQVAELRARGVWLKDSEGNLLGIAQRKQTE